MFEEIKISELDPESLNLTKMFVQNLLEGGQKILSAPPSKQEAAAAQEIITASQDMLRRITFDLTRRSIGQQAAAAARA